MRRDDTGLSRPRTLQFRFLGDPQAAFTKALELDFDGTAIFGGPRSKRYALVIKDGKVKSAHVEPDSTGTDGTSLSTLWGIPRSFLPLSDPASSTAIVSMADKVLG